MIDQSFLNSLQNLSSEERTLIGKFQNDPTGATFVLIADLLRTRGFIEEAIVVLEDGLIRFPKYSSARAALARDYYSQGLLEQANKEARVVLADAPDNAQAHLLLVRLLVVFDQRDELLSRLRSTERIIPDDELTQSIRKAIATGDWTSAQKWVRSELERSGISIFQANNQKAVPVGQSELHFGQARSAIDKGVAGPDSLPERSSHLGWQVPSSQQPQDLSAPENVNARVGATRSPELDTVQKLAEDGQPEAMKAGSSLAHIRGDVDRYLLLRGYRSLTIDGFFAGRDGLVQSSGIEPLTLAELYRSQGMYLRAMEIYERLLRDSPRNIEYQAAYSELREALKRDYIDAGADLAASSSEQIQRDNKKIQKLRQLIGRLNDKTG